MDSLPWYERSGGLLLHGERCDWDVCPVLEPRFPAYILRATCTGEARLRAAGIWWPDAIRGTTRRLSVALRDALGVAAQLGLTVRVDPAPPTTMRELFDEGVIRLPVDPGSATGRAEIRKALQLTLGAAGLVLADARVFSELGMTSAGLIALAGLHTLHVPIAWDALVWEAITSHPVSVDEVRRARERIRGGADTLQQVAARVLGTRATRTDVEPTKV